MNTKQLLQLFNEGNLGNFLAERFKGKLHALCQAKDSDFIIVFPDEDKTPDIGTLQRIVTLEYKRLGCKVEDIHHDDSSHTCCLQIQGEEACVWYNVTMTTRYPHQETNANLRVNCIPSL